MHSIDRNASKLDRLGPAKRHSFTDFQVTEVDTKVEIIRALPPGGCPELSPLGRLAKNSGPKPPQNEACLLFPAPAIPAQLIQINFGAPPCRVMVGPRQIGDERGERPRIGLPA